MNESVKSLRSLHETAIKNVPLLKELMQEGFKNYKELKALSIFLNNNSFRMTHETEEIAKNIEKAAALLYKGLQLSHDTIQKWWASKIGLD